MKCFDQLQQYLQCFSFKLVEENLEKNQKCRDRVVAWGDLQAGLQLTDYGGTAGTKSGREPMVEAGN